MILKAIEINEIQVNPTLIEQIEQVTLTVVDDYSQVESEMH